MDECGLLNLFECGKIPLELWVSDGLRWLVDNYRPFFQAMKWPVDQVLRNFEWALGSVPPTLMLTVFALAAWQIAGVRLMLGVVASLILVGFLGIWPQTMTTLAVVFTAVVLCLIIGLPLGIWAARSDRFYGLARPILDGMQTIPAFVYLVPIVMLFGIGNVPGVIVTVIFALPPVIRLTNLGIRQVPNDVVEAMLAFGASDRQLLWKAQLPLAMPSIMAGVNQTLMMSLSMVVIASMIAVGGLGQMVLRGIGRLDMGIATVGGLGIVMLAIVLDRLTQSMAQSSRDRGGASWRQRGPAGLFLRWTGATRAR
ncbi:MAG: glycine betaine/L-proline ABC transporter permease ProW [Alphaproteobacteria bacterium]|nr:glycine betaine/L-proline ABC transporter permease ProW [Alphaproteobacteria bacterium]